jgi:cold-inducible RNA-binding protein
MITKIYVDNLAPDTTKNELMNVFSPYGNVMEVNVAVDHTSQKPRGFGFVTMVTPEGARAAIRALNGKPIGTCTLTASEAWPREERASAPNGRRRDSRIPACSTDPAIGNAL